METIQGVLTSWPLARASRGLLSEVHRQLRRQKDGQEAPDRHPLMAGLPQRATHGQPAKREDEQNCQRDAPQAGTDHAHEGREVLVNADTFQGEALAPVPLDEAELVAQLCQNHAEQRGAGQVAAVRTAFAHGSGQYIARPLAPLI